MVVSIKYMKTKIMIGLLMLGLIAPAKAQVFGPNGTAGALVGGVIGAVVGKNPVKGAAIGAGAGLVLGTIADNQQRTTVMVNRPVYYSGPAYEMVYSAEYNTMVPAVSVIAQAPVVYETYEPTYYVVQEPRVVYYSPPVRYVPEVRYVESHAYHRPQQHVQQRHAPPVPRSPSQNPNRKH